MCGIIGIVSYTNTTANLISGLKRLEYRGYDSAGIAVVNGGVIERRRAEGKLSALEEVLARQPLQGSLGIGHTRWATHGAPNEQNAHPHATSKVAVVHNGIIENHKILRQELERKGCKFASDTDTEVIPHLITTFLEEGKAPREAVQAAMHKLQGAFAIAVIFAGKENLLIGARQGSPLVAGYGRNEMYLGSDAYALAPLTSNLVYLEEGDVVELNRENIRIFDKSGHEVQRNVHTSAISDAATGKGEYRHYMLKEIYQQPEVIEKTLSTYIHGGHNKIQLPSLPFDFKGVSKITIIACGTSYYAGLVAKYWFEHYARIPVEIDIASEFRYRNAPMIENGVVLCISQSGETADTLAALRFAKEHGQKVVAIVNARESSMEREADITLHTHAGPEIGVASTKAFTTQLVVLACLALAAAEAKATLAPTEHQALIRALRELPSHTADVLNLDHALGQLARNIVNAQDILYIGRGTSYPVALEGALKLKELSYIHAEGIAAGELKHGPIALVDETVPVIVIAPFDGLFEKTASNVQEVATRGGRVIFLSDRQGAEHLQEISMETLVLPTVHPFITPMVYVIPVQLLAYHIAVYKGTDVDQPRNLAKSVTVE